MPEAAVGGPIAGGGRDIISINIRKPSGCETSEEEMESRRAKWQPRQPQVTTGYLDRCRKMVTSANREPFWKLSNIPRCPGDLRIIKARHGNRHSFLPPERKRNTDRERRNGECMQLTGGNY